MVKGATAVGKRSPLPRRAAGEKKPVLPRAAYRTTSTNSELPHWPQGVVFLQDPLDFIVGPFQIVRTIGCTKVTDKVLEEGSRLEHNHIGCGLVCGGLTGNLAATETHKLTCHMPGQFIPEGLCRDPCDPVNYALTFNEIVWLLLRLLDPLQTERSRILDPQRQNCVQSRRRS